MWYKIGIGHGSNILRCHIVNVTIQFARGICVKMIQFHCLILLFFISFFLPFIYPILLKELICYSLIGQLLKENEQGNL